MTHYILGLLTADGSAREYCTISGESTYSCDLEMAEEQIILDIAKFLNKTVFYRERVIKNKQRKFWKVSFHTNDIEMIKYGKYLVKGRPKIYELYKSFSKPERADFVRGLFDGDGVCSYETSHKKKKVRIGFCGHNRDFVENYRNFLINKLDMNQTKLFNTGGCWQCSWSSKKDLINFYNYIYKDATIFLGRKKKKISDYVNTEVT